MSLNLTDLEAVVGRMTPGPWNNSVADWHVHAADSGEPLAVCDCMNDAQGIVALRNAAPELIAAARERDELAGLLRRIRSACADIEEPCAVLPADIIKALDAALAKVGPS
jgi:hypothetical protein